MTTRQWLRLGAAWLACALAACGGGIGDDGVNVTSNRSSLTLVGVNGSVAPSAPITFTLHGGSGTYYGMAESDNDALEASFEPLSDTTAEVRVQSRGSVAYDAPGSGHVTFKLCSDENCNNVVSSKQIPYTLTMFTVNLAPVTLTGSEGAVSKTVSRSIDPPDTAGMLDFKLDGDPSIHVEHSNPASVDFSGSGVGISAGSYSAALEISAKEDGTVQSFIYGTPVSFTVGSGLVAPAVPSIDVVATSTSASLTGSAPVRFVGTQAPDWTAHSNSGWLVLDTASGTGPGDITYHVDTTELAAMPNWGSSTAQVTIASSGLTSVSFPVTLNKHLPEVTMVTPSGVASGQPVTVRVSGRGLTQLSTIDDFRVGATVPTSVTINSDTSATLHLAALPAGATEVRAVSTLGEAGPYAVLGAAPQGTFASTSVVNGGEKRAVVFDPSRNAVFATNMSRDKLVRFQLVGGQWKVSELPVAQVGYLALAPDRRTVYVASGSKLLAVDPDSMAIRKRYDAGRSLAGGYNYSVPLAVTSNLRVWMTGEGDWSGMSYFDLRRESFGEQDVDFGTLYSPAFFGSANGQVLYVDNPPSLSPPLPNYWYITASDKLTAPTGQPIAKGSVSMDDRGSAALLDDEQLYRVSDWSLIGKAEVIDPPVGGFGWLALVSPDGRRIYREVSDSNNAIDRIDVFDATRLAAGQSRFVKLGSIALPVKAVGCNVELTDPCDGSGRLVIDPTGTTLFWIGGARMVVLPIPDALSGANAATTEAAALTKLRKAAVGR